MRSKQTGREKATMRENFRKAQDPKVRKRAGQTLSERMLAKNAAKRRRFAQLRDRANDILGCHTDLAALDRMLPEDVKEESRGAWKKRREKRVQARWPAKEFRWRGDIRPFIVNSELGRMLYEDCLT